MSNYYSPGKRQRESVQARKKQEKAQERADKRARGPRELPVVSADDINGNTGAAIKSAGDAQFDLTRTRPC